MEPLVTYSYPVFLIYQDIGTGHYPVITDSKFGKCVIAFQGQELAELYIEQIRQANDKFLAKPLDENEFKSLLRANSNVTLVAWNTLVTSRNAIFTPVALILREAADSGG